MENYCLFKLILIICAFSVKSEVLNSSEDERERLIPPAVVLNIDISENQDDNKDEDIKSSQGDVEDLTSNFSATSLELTTTVSNRVVTLSSQAHMNMTEKYDDEISAEQTEPVPDSTRDSSDKLEQETTTNLYIISQSVGNENSDESVDSKDSPISLIQEVSTVSSFQSEHLIIENPNEIEEGSGYEQDELSSGYSYFEPTQESNVGIEEVEPTLYFLSKVGFSTLSTITSSEGTVDLNTLSETGTPVSMSLMNESQIFNGADIEFEEKEGKSRSEINVSTEEHHFVPLSSQGNSDDPSQGSLSYLMVTDLDSSQDYSPILVAKNVTEELENNGRFQFPTNDDSSNLIHEEVIVNQWGIPEQCSSFVTKEKEKHLAIIQDLLLAKYELDAIKLNLSIANSAISIPSENLKLLLSSNLNLTLFMNNGEKGILIVSEDLHLEMTSPDAFTTFGLLELNPSEENVEPSLINNDWLQINAQKKFRTFIPRNVPKDTWITLVCHEPKGCSILLNTKIFEETGSNQLTSFHLSDEHFHSEITFHEKGCLKCDNVEYKLGFLESKETDFIKVCDVRCLLHGDCIDGKCVCQVGWNGQHCSIMGCPDECNGRGSCLKENGLWQCFCEQGWESESCSHPKELECSDRLDNDEDGLIDCEDPDCCQLSIDCRGKQLCMSVSDPRSLTSSQVQHSTFWSRIKFLVDELHGIQRYAKANGFDPNTVCVVRGRTVTEYGSPILGTRISRENRPQEGFTLSREDGYFDFVDSCESRQVELLFGKSPFVFIEENFDVMPNRINHVGDIILHVPGHAMKQKENNEICESILHELNLSIDITWNITTNQQTNSQIELFGTPLMLFYDPESNDSTFQVHVSAGPKCCDPWIHKTTISFSIEGYLFTQLFEPESKLLADFVWNKTDSYGQRVFGKSQGSLEVCFHGVNKGCQEVICQKRTVELVGHNPHKKDFGGWSLGIHHHLDVQNGILYLGNGQIDDLTEGEPSLRPSRLFYENKSDGFQPIGLAVDDAEIMIFILTMTDVRGISRLNRTESILLHLDSKSFGVRNYITYNSKHKLLIVSLPNEKIVVGTQVNISSDGAFIASSWFKLVGNGKSCVGNKACGDGGEAGKAKLAYPKGLATLGDLLYIADGHRIRVVNLVTVQITTFVGKVEEEWSGKLNTGDCKVWRQLSMTAQLSWPTAIAIDPLNEELYLIDGGQLRSVDANKNIFDHCIQVASTKTDEIKNLKFSRKGDLYLYSKNEDKVNIMIKVKSDGTSAVIPLEQDVDVIGDFAILNTEETLYSEPEKSRLSILSRGRFEKNENNHFVVNWPIDDEVYIFSDEGYHLETRSLFTDASLLQFTYSEEKRIKTVKDQAVAIIEYTDGGNLSFNFSNNKFAANLSISNSTNLLESIMFVSGQEIRLEYDDKMLLKGKSGKKDAFSHPNALNFEFLERFGGSIFLSYQAVKATHRPLGTVHLYNIDSQQLAKQEFIQFCNRSSFNLTFVCHQGNKTSRFDFQERQLPRRFGADPKTLQLPKSVLFVAEFYRNVNVTWEYYLKQHSRSFDGFSGAGKHFQIDGKTQFSVEVHPRSLVQSLYDNKSQQILRVEEFYIPPNRLWIPAPPLAMVDEHFDLSGKVLSWKWGNLTEVYTYDTKDRMVQVKIGSDQEINYIYDEKIYPKQVITSLAGTFTLSHNSFGELKSIITPEGQVHSWKVIPSILNYVIEYQPPWAEKPFMFAFYFGQNDGQPFQIYYPSGATILTAHKSSSNSVSCGIELCQTITTSKNEIRTQIASSRGEKVDIIKTISLNSETVVSNLTSIELGTKISSTELSYTPERDSFLNLLVTISIEETSMSTKMKINYLTKRIESIGNYSFTYDPTSVIIKNEIDSFIYVADLDGNGQESSQTILADGEVIYHNKLSYSNNGLLNSQTVRTKKSVVNMSYTYNGNGQIHLHDEGKFFQWHHKYDTSGNLINADYGTGNTSREYEFGERVANIDGLFVSYDKDGRQVKRHNLSFLYNDFSKLVEVKESGKSTLSFYYDDLQRLMVKFDFTTLETTTFFYTLKDKPFIVTQIYSDKQNEIRHLIYDNKDRLLVILSNRREALYATTDQSGTVTLLLNKQGDIVQSPLRTPFGEYIEQPIKGDIHWIPIGFRGGIEDPKAGIVIFNGRGPYDSVLGQWMVPQISQILKPDLTPIESIFTYRFLNNNPLKTDHPKSYMDSLDDWLRLYQISLPKEVLKEANVPDMLKIFERTELEDRLRIKNQRRPKLCDDFELDTKIFGGNKLAIITEPFERIGTNPDDPSFFRQRIFARSNDLLDEKAHGLATLLEGSIIMSPNSFPLIVDIFVTKQDFKMDLEEIIRTLHARVLEVDGEMVVFRTHSYNTIDLTFWTGFKDIQAAEMKRDSLR